MGTSALRLKVRCSHISCVFYQSASIKSIKMADADAIKKICDIYDWHGKGQLDLFYLGDIMYALGFNITKKICMANGQQEEECKKFASFDEVVTMVNAALKTPEMSGNYHDYIELCKLYDKNENGTMMWLNWKTSCPTWLMRSPRKIPKLSSLNWLTQKMKMVSSHTLHSSTDCAARLKLVPKPIYLTRTKTKESIQNYLVIKMSFRKVCTFFSDSQDSLKNRSPKY